MQIMIVHSRNLKSIKVQNEERVLVYEVHRTELQNGCVTPGK